MTLTMGTGPFGPRPGGLFNLDIPGRDRLLYFEDSPRRVRAMFNHQTVADSRHVKLLHEHRLLPVYYFPVDDVRRDLLEPSGHVSECGLKGQARYWSVRVGDRRAENAVWAYPEPRADAAWLAGHMAFYWDAMDAWYEEDQQVFGHPRDPYHRVDVVPSSRHVRVGVGGEVLAESHRPRLLFETGLPTRYYLPPADVREELLVASSTTTRCPYKGLAAYWSVKAGGQLHADLVWSYPDPEADALGVAGYLCFYNERVDLEVDGQTQERPETPFA